MYLQTLPPLSWSHAVSWCVCAEAFKKGCMVWLSKNCSLITLHIAVFLKALVEQRHFHYIHRARKWNPTWNLRGRAYVCLTITHTHTKNPTVSVMSFSWHTSIHPSPAPLSPSLRPSSRAAQIHLCDWLPSISSSSHENKSQLGLKRFGKEANDLIKTLNREARMKLINYRQRGTFLTFYIYIYRYVISSLGW